MLRLILPLILILACTPVHAATNEERCDLWRKTVDKVEKRILVLAIDKSTAKDQIEYKIIDVEQSVLMRMRQQMIEQYQQVCVF